MSTEHHESDLPEHVFSAELEEINTRRLQSDPDSQPLEGPPSTDHGLIGLALSGGGIRSATFSLGVVQALADQDHLGKIDYLSTVSGGGYIGGSISSLLTSPDTDTSKENFPLRRLESTGAAVETKALTHLRNSSNYLGTGGLLQATRIPTLFLRGLVLNLLIFLPFIMVAVVLVDLAYEYLPNLDTLSSLLPYLLGLFGLATLLFPVLSRRKQQKQSLDSRNIYELLLAVPLILVVLVLVLIPLLRITRWAIEHNWTQFADAMSDPRGIGIWIWVAVATVLIAALSSLGRASERVAEARGKLVIMAVGLLGPALLFGVFLLLALIQIDSPFLPARFCDVLPEDANSELKIEAKQANEIEADLIEAFKARNIDVDGATVTAKPRDNWTDDWEPPCPPNTWTITTDDAEVVIERVSLNSLEIAGRGFFEDWREILILPAAAVLFLFNTFVVNVNLTALHGFYRDRLSRAFIFRLDEKGEVDRNDGQRLSDLNPPETVAPYHLINGTLNLQSDGEDNLRGRGSTSFLFSKRYVGSTHTDYATTTDVEQYDPELSLASAVATSGAAASPNMGTTTLKPLVFIMTLLNLRLGYWVPNPRAVNRTYRSKKLRLGRVPPSLLLKEATGALDAKGQRVNVSDGGHFENLGIYPLLQRRCKLIIAVDGEQDPDSNYPSLAKLMRYARIDMGTEIDLDPDSSEMRASREDSTKGLTTNRWALATITYGNGETGKLLYIKLSINGDEPEDIKGYRRTSGAFPHESTADQYFSEEQFEAYRALGDHIGKKMLAEAEIKLALSRSGA